MKIAVDFDGTIVVQDGRRYDDVTTPPELLPFARDGLRALKRAGHTLLLWSARSSLALVEDPGLDPFVRAGVVEMDREAWRASHALHVARRDQMLAFVAAELSGIFDAVDDGRAGKPCVDMFIDDRAVRLGFGGAAQTWPAIARTWGSFW